MNKDSEVSIEKDVQKICFGGTFARVEDGLGTPQIVILRAPSLKDKVFIDFLYDEAIRDAKSRGLISEIELRLAYNRKGIWTQEQDQKVEQLAARVRELNSQIGQTTRAREKRVMARTLSSARDRLEDLLRLKHELFGIAAEKHAEDTRQSAYVYASAYDFDGNKLWPTYDDFEAEKDFTLIRNISIAISDTEEIDGKRIRQIARSPDWRFQWVAGKNADSLFGRPIVELDIQQQALIYWSQVYDSVYESMDKPDDSVIEDDERLDEWFKNQERKEKVKKVEGGEQAGSIKLSKGISRHGEIFIVTNPQVNPHAPSMQEVDELNDSMTRKFKQAEVDKIKQHGQINEKDLRDRKNKIARKLIGSNAAIIGKGSLGGTGRGGKGASKVVPGHLI